jgi:NTP pyrophosphatase (non-canonical NTP hydrolase)
MNFNDYQHYSKRTMNMKSEIFSSCVDRLLSISNLSMGLAGEAGETIDYLKKVYFHGHELDKEKLKLELGDVLWYVSNLALLHEISLNDVARSNIEKLEKRYPSGFSSEKSIEREE